MHVGVLQAAERIEKGEIVAIPTDTVYGLACDFHSGEALDRLFALKERSESNPLLILAADIHAIEPYLLTEPKSFYQLADAFWPGALTLVLPVDQSQVPARVRADLPTAGFRVPANTDALELLRVTGPLVVTSANFSGEPPATTADQVEAIFEDLPVIDGGECEEGVPSTILVYEEGRWRRVRSGAISLEAIQTVTGS